MRNRALRLIAAIISIICLTGMPAQAAPIAISEVVQMLSNYQNPPDLRLRGSLANNSALPPGVKSSLQVNASSINTAIALNSGQTGIDSLLSGMSLYSSDPQGVEAIVTADVDATICDCGEIPVAGGFPKWPLLFLAAIPLLFIHEGGDEEVCEDCTITPTCLDCTPTPTCLNCSPTPTCLNCSPTPTCLNCSPTPTPTGVPEPASILLLASGLAALGAGARRRYARTKLEAEIKSRAEA
jgi:hypothetical protein